MRKTLLLAVLLPLPAGIFAVDFSLSAGAGGLLGYTFTRYTLEEGKIKSAQSMDRFNFGGFLFFDATYGEFTVMIQRGNSTYAENMIQNTTSLADSTGKGYETSLGLSLMGKYPFGINERFTWFPMFGVEYQIALVQIRQPKGESPHDRTTGYLMEDRDKNDKSYPLHAWNAFWINIGAGLDFAIAGPLFLRSELLFGFRLPTGYEMGALEVVKKPPTNVSNPMLAGLTGSPGLKIAVGYRF